MRRCLCCVLLSACSAPWSRDVSIDRVEPAAAPSTDVVPVRIEGSFYLPITSDLDNGDTTVVDVAVTIGDTPIVDAVWVDAQLIEGVIPAGLPVGPHDVRVTLGEQTGVRVEGYVVLGSNSTVDAGVDAMCMPGFLDLCSQPQPTMALAITTATTINTDTDPRCVTLNQATGGPACLIYATAVDISSTGSLTASGSRPLAIASSSSMTIAGTIDVSSRRATGQLGPGADFAGCTFAAIPEQDLGGAGGGAGGSFAAAGGNGGTGDLDSSIGADGMAAPGLPGPIATISALRGGCRGQQGANESGASGGIGGTGGHSGGALYLYASQQIMVTGQIVATGAGGEGGQVQAGGGGGGSGGLVVIESPSITVSGQISANSGGGGEGGTRIGTTPTSGNPGADGALGTTPAPGGSGGPGSNGDGGPGTAGTMLVGGNGQSTTSGAGGGGGAAGIIRLRGGSSVTGVVSPPPS